MAILSNGDPLVLALIKALGLPKGVKRFTLSAGVNEVVTVTAEFDVHYDGAAGEKIIEPFVGCYALSRLDPIRETDVSTLDSIAVETAAAYRRA